MSPSSPEVILALNTADRDTALKWVSLFAGELRWFKVGLPLFFRYGPDILNDLRKEGAQRIFLDVKLHEIPSVMRLTVEALQDLPVDMLTVHLLAGHVAIEEALQGWQRTDRRPLFVGVTLLSSMDARALSSILPDPIPPREWSLHLAYLADRLRLDGVVASGDVAVEIKERLPHRILVVPGIRWEEQKADDQRRILTPAEAASAGFEFLVVGRPLTHVPDPLRALQELKRQLQEAGGGTAA